MIMDTTKKYLYFNNRTGDTDSSVMMPVSTCVGFETTGASDVKFYFKSAPDTDTLDIQLDRTTNSNPRELFEHIVNQINFAKDSVITIGDDFTEEYIHPDITAVNNISDAGDSRITFSKPATFLVDNVSAGFAEDAGDGFDTGSYTANTGSVGMINGEVITTLFIDLDGLTCDATGGKAIGIDGSSNPAYITQITTAKNGIVYRGEMICVEVGTGAGSETTNQVDLVANTSGTIQPGGNVLSGTNDLLVDQNGAFTLGEVRNFDSSVITDDNPSGTIPAGGIQNRYLYLSLGTSSQTGGDFTSGKYIIRLYGAPTVNLNDIS